jgi:Protein of unknown function (DUF4240)
MRSLATLAAVVAGLALIAGCSAGTDAQNTADAGAAPSVPQTTGDDASGDPTGDEPDEASEPAEAAEPAPQTPGGDTNNVASGQLDEAGFWRLIAQTRSAAGNDTSRQSELLKERLSKLAPQAIIDFARIRQRLDRGAYTWNLWGAAYVIEDGCSDDCFRDFRGYVISLGRGPYQRAMSNPDSLASVAQDAETGSWENADNVAPDAYSSATGGDYPLDDSDLSGRPRGKPFNENKVAALIRRYPRLAARFR